MYYLHSQAPYYSLCYHFCIYPMEDQCCQLFWQYFGFYPPTLLSKYVSHTFIWGAVSCAFTMFYIKYLFNTIEDNIKLCLKCRNSKLVIKAINEHRIAEQMCKDMNDIYKICNFVLYFIFSPAHMLNIYYLFNKNIPATFRYISIILFVLTYSLIFVAILLNSRIIQSAHSTRKYFNAYLISDSLPFKHRMKIMAFIEKLCGPDIGFYCMDWFPLNYFEFHKYCAFCASFYFMVVSIFTRSNLF